MSLREVLIDELKDLYSAENQLVKALPKTAKAIESQELKQIVLTHLEETRGQVERLQQIFAKLDKKATGKHCKGMEGALDEVKEALDEDTEGALFDAGILGAGARVEHYEIAGYTSAIAIATTLGESEVVSLLKQSLAEEQNAVKLMTIAGRTILKQAYEQEGDDPGKPEKKAKDAKEKLSERQSEKDERDAKPGMEMSAEGAMESAPEKKAHKKKKK